MYEDTWYSFVPEHTTKKEEPAVQALKHRRRESLLKQPNGSTQISDPSEVITELFEETPALQGPPEATLARRAKSCGDFYDVARAYIAREVEKEKLKDVLDISENKRSFVDFESRFEEQERDLLEASHEEYHLYRDQLAVSERHLENLLENTTSALDLLASLSESFKTVESQTKAFQAQCEDLLTEQKRVRDLADEVGTHLQYYAYLEPLTRRLNAPGAGRLVRNDDFLDMLRNLNTCIEFMDIHKDYRDSHVYGTRYRTLLGKALDLVTTTFSDALREVTTDVSKQVKLKDLNETTEYILLFGKFESIPEKLGTVLEQLLTTREFAFGWRGDGKDRSSYLLPWHDTWKALLELYLRSRELVSPVVLQNLRKFAINQPKPDEDFTLFARRCVNYTFDICHNEFKMMLKFFHDGPLLSKYPNLATHSTAVDYAEKLEKHCISYLTTLHTFLTPYLSTGDLQRVSKLVSWLEDIGRGPMEYEEDDAPPDQDQDHRSLAQAFLSNHLWPLFDALCIKEATEMAYYKPTQEDLKIPLPSKTLTENTKKPIASVDTKTQADHDAQRAAGPGVTNAYPTVKKAVGLLIMYNDSAYDRPKDGDVLYEIVHQTTESLQRAATIIKRNSTIMDAQVFLIKNLMLIENLFMTHEIPDSIRQSAELDFSPIWTTIKELQDRKQLFNPLAYITPLVKGNLLPAVVDQLLDARKELEKVLVQQITAFTKHWQSRLAEKDPKKKDAVAKATRELDSILESSFEDETTRAALWRMIRSEDS